MKVGPKQSFPSCRDARNMAKDVRFALVDILGKFLTHQRQGSFKEGSEVTQVSRSALEEAEVVLTKMKEEGRYLVDAW